MHSLMVSSLSRTSEAFLIVLKFLAKCIFSDYILFHLIDRLQFTKPFISDSIFFYYK